MSNVGMTLARIMVNDPSIQEYKLKRMSRNVKMSGSSDPDQTSFKKMAQT